MGARATPARDFVAEAFAPGHITVLFAPELAARDPRARGSIGAGFVLELGARARARWRPGGRRSVVRIASEPRGPLPISSEVAARLLGQRRGRLEVRLEHDLPVGQGFGMSAAGALATALAVAPLLRVPRRRAVETAHLAELYGGGGLGGVSAILGGGVEQRERAGLPPRGRVSHRPYRGRLLLTVVGRSLPSERLLRSSAFLARVRRTGTPLVQGLGPRAPAAAIMRAGERFSDRLGLSPARLRARVRALRAVDAFAGQTMFGESLWIVPRSPRAREKVIDRLRGWELPAVEVALARHGARRLRPRRR